MKKFNRYTVMKIFLWVMSVINIVFAVNSCMTHSVNEVLAHGLFIVSTLIFFLIVFLYNKSMGEKQADEEEEGERFSAEFKVLLLFVLSIVMLLLC